MFCNIVCALLVAFMASCYSLIPVCFAQTYKIGRLEIEAELPSPYRYFDRTAYSEDFVENKKVRAFMEANNVYLVAFFDDEAVLYVISKEFLNDEINDLSKLTDEVLKSEDFKATYIKGIETKKYRIKKDTFEIKNFNNIKYIKYDASLYDENKWFTVRVYKTIKDSTVFIFRFGFLNDAKILPDKFTNEVISGIRFKEEKTAVPAETAASEQKKNYDEQTTTEPAKQKPPASAPVNNSSSGDNEESTVSTATKNASLNAVITVIVFFIMGKIFIFLMRQWNNRKNK